MSVLYVGTLDREGTCYARLMGLREVERHVESFDSDEYFPSSRPRRNAIERRAFVGPVFRELNTALLSTCNKLRPDVVWIDKGYWIWPSTLCEMRRSARMLIHHNTDALYPKQLGMRWLYLLLRQTLPLYDLYFTTNIVDFERLAWRAAPRTLLTSLGYDHTRFDNSPLPRDVEERYRNDVVFVGHYEKRTEEGIVALARAGVRVHVRGAGWHRADNAKELSNVVTASRCTNAEYLCLLKGAKIALGFVSAINNNQTAGRTFEIPACGTFLLAFRTLEHTRCYEEGQEAEFFSSREELLDKALYYLHNDDDRSRVARLGHDRCVTSGYSWASIMRSDWRRVNEILSARLASPRGDLAGRELPVTT